MVFDAVTAIQIILAILIGIGIYYAYNKYSVDKVNKVYKVIKTIYTANKEKIEADNPELAKECENAISVMDMAMADSNISLTEAFDIVKVFVPLMTRLVKYIDSKTKN